MADNDADRSGGWTLGAIRARGMRLEAACQAAGCGYFAVFDLDRLIAQVGPDYPLPDSGPGMPCDRCWGELTFQLAVWPPITMARRPGAARRADCT